MAVALIAALIVLLYFVWTKLFRIKQVESYTDQPMGELGYFRDQNNPNQYYYSE